MKRFTKVFRTMVAALVMVLALTLMVTTDVDAAAKKTVKITNLPSNTVTIKQKKTFTLKANYAASKLRFKSSKPKIAKVSSKGVIKGVKKGKAQITVTLKADKKVKTKINVIVGTPVSKVSLSKTSMTLVTGGAATLKATVAGKTASNKKVIWTTSDPKVATVSSAGKVTAVKAGTVTITATAADGSRKKASCRVTVADPVKIAAATIVNQQTIQVKLSGAQALGMNDFNVKVRSSLNGRYNKVLKIDNVTTTDKINYTIKLNVENRLNDKEQLRIEVSRLFGTGTQAVETVYSEGKFTLTEFRSYVFSKDSSVSESIYLDCASMGYCDVTVTGLPEGVTYKVYQFDEYYSDKIYFSGTATKAGTYPSVVKIVDELGNIYITYLTWHITSEDSISAYAAPTYSIISDDEGAYIATDIKIYGGSESYICYIEGEDYGLTVSSRGYLRGYISKPGTYNVKVVVKDSNNAALTKTVTCNINVASSVELSGVIKDKNGNVIPDAYIGLTNKDKGNMYVASTSCYSVSGTGKYSLKAVPGTYDILVSVGGYKTWIYGKSITADTTFDIPLDVLKVEVISNNADIPSSSFGEWTDENGTSYGTGSYIYVKPGTYKLTAVSDIIKATINATILDNTKCVTAVMGYRDDIINIGDNSVTNAYDGSLFGFKATKTGTYYIYSTSDSRDPYGSLYNANGEFITGNDDGGKNIESLYKYDFYMEVTLEAGKTYFVKVKNSPCKLHVTTTKPE